MPMPRPMGQRRRPRANRRWNARPGQPGTTLRENTLPCDDAMYWLEDLGKLLGDSFRPLERRRAPEHQVPIYHIATPTHGHGGR